MAIDNDYQFLKSHLTYIGAIRSRDELAQKVASVLTDRIKNGKLPYTLGIFGGWGAGKTTFLALLANELDKAHNCKIVYFNSWKYAGFMEIVPALIYKILQYGLTKTSVAPEKAAKRILLALGKKYSDQIGDWAKTKIGINVTELFKDAYDLKRTIESSEATVSDEVIHAYYTQVDKAQDELRQALGPVVPGQHPEHAVVVLIDELDRCDPDEAFNVIKQMRVLFGMRDLPVAFVVCANPDPIGRAIQTRYGLKSNDYEARRILEKFVDSYEDLGEAVALRSVVSAMWQGQALPWIINFDEANEAPPFQQSVFNAKPFDAITSGIPLLANLRVLHKSFEYVNANADSNRHLLWTKWFLEIAKQIDPDFRSDLGTLAKPIQRAVYKSYCDLHKVKYEIRKLNGKPAVAFTPSDKGRTLFTILRSYFWENARNELNELNKSRDPESVRRAQALTSLLEHPGRVDFVMLLSLLPFERAPMFETLSSTAGSNALPDLSAELNRLDKQFGYVLANP